MHGFSPRDYSLTARQIQISTEVLRSVPELPVPLTDLISQMAMPDFSLACQALDRSYLARIMNKLKERGECINLDDVVLNVLDLSSTAVRIDLCGMSAKRATFNKINMKYLKLIEADLSGAQFIDTSLEQADISKANVTGATFENVKIQGTVASELTGNQSKIFACSQTYPDKVVVNNVPTIVGNIYLNLDADYVVPDTDSYTLLPKKFPDVLKLQKRL